MAKTRGAARIQLDQALRRLHGLTLVDRNGTRTKDGNPSLRDLERETKVGKSTISKWFNGQSLAQDKDGLLAVVAMVRAEMERQGRLVDDELRGFLHSDHWERLHAAAHAENVAVRTDAGNAARSGSALGPPRRRWWRDWRWRSGLAVVIVIAVVVGVVLVLDGDPTDGDRPESAGAGAGATGTTGSPAPTDLEVADISFGTVEVAMTYEDKTPFRPLPSEALVHISLHNPGTEIAYLRNAVVTVTRLSNFRDCRGIGGGDPVFPAYTVKTPDAPAPPLPHSTTVDFPGWEVAPKSYENISFSLGPEGMIAGDGWWAYRFTVSLERDQGKPPLTTPEIAVLAPVDQDLTPLLTEYETYARENVPGKGECVASGAQGLHQVFDGAAAVTPELRELSGKVDAMLR